MVIPYLHLVAGSLFDREDHISALMRELVIENDRVLDRYLEIQLNLPGERFDGGLPNQFEIPSTGGTGMLIQYAVSAYISPESRYYQSPLLEKSMLKAADFLLRNQHSDGTIDLLSTNFHSPPDTGFTVEPVALAYGLMVRHNILPKVVSKLATFLKNAGEALAVGGIHTPNHRWVVCMALARIYEHFPQPKYLSRIDRWLSEHIDIDPDGQYTEKSTLVYSPIVNRCLITVARIFNRKELLEPVRKNLQMTLFYVHPNGEVVSEASGRQDRDTIGTMERYYYSYRYMAIYDEDGEFAAMTRQIPLTVTGARLVRELGMLLEDDFLRKDLPASAKMPDEYIRVFPYSNLARIRRKNRDTTILGNTNTFLTFQHGEAVLAGIRLNASFFGSKGQFLPPEIRQQEELFVLRYDSTGPYYQPYPSEGIDPDGDWEKMPRENRPHSEVQQLSYLVTIRENPKGITIGITVQGTDHVPVALEMAFRSGGTLSGVSTVEGIEDAYLLEEGMGTYQMGNDRIIFGPGSKAHSWTQLRGAPPKMDAMSVYLTGYTPFSREITITEG